MTSAAEIIKAAIPNATERQIDYVMWERTPYPIARVSPKTIYKAASSTYRAGLNGIRQCDLCDRGRVFDDKWVCERCERLLKAHREEYGSR